MKQINRQKNHHIVSFITAAMLATTVFSIPAAGFADTATETSEVPQMVEQQADSWRYENGELIDETEIQEDAGDLTQGAGGDMTAKTASHPAWSESNGKFYSSNGKVIEGAIRKGVDVSAWQDDINWEKVKASGIDFAIIRCGYSSNYTKYDDKKWARNVSECERLGIPYGVYIYSYADSLADAESEARHVLRLLKGHTPAYPIYYDLEDRTTLKAGKTAITKIANKFCSMIESNGYTAGIYANLNWWNNYLTDSSLNKYEKWVAQYYYKCSYTKKYRIWQCTSSGTVPGIDGKVDLNFEFNLGDGFDPYNTGDAQLSPYAIKGWVKNSKGQYVLVRYNGQIVKSKWVTLNGKKYYANSSGVRTTGYKKIGYYYYLFDSYGVLKTGDVVYNGRQYELGTNGRSTLYNVKTARYLNYRTGPSTKYTLKGTYKSSRIVPVIREYNGWGKMRNGYWIKLSYTSRVTKYPVVVPYKVKTTCSLNGRTGPSSGYSVKYTYKKGTLLSIERVKNGWGKTKSGHWVLLRYTKRI